MSGTLQGGKVTRRLSFDVGVTTVSGCRNAYGRGSCLVSRTCVVDGLTQWGGLSATTIISSVILIDTSKTQHPVFANDGCVDEINYTDLRIRCDFTCGNISHNVTKDYGKTFLPKLRLVKQPPTTVSQHLTIFTCSICKTHVHENYITVFRDEIFC